MTAKLIADMGLGAIAQIGASQTIGALMGICAGGSILPLVLAGCTIGAIAGSIWREATGGSYAI